MNAILFFLVAIFGNYVEGAKFKAIRRRVIKFLPPNQNGGGEWRSPVHKNSKLLYSYNGPNGLQYNMHGSDGAYGKYVNGRQIYQALAHGGRGTGGIGIHGMINGDTSGLGGIYGQQGVRFKPILSQNWQNSANGGQISLSSHLSGPHSAASSYGSVTQNTGRSQLNTADLNTYGDNAGKVTLVSENGENEVSTDNVIYAANNEGNRNVGSLVNADNFDIGNKVALDNVDQSVLNAIGNAPANNMINGLGINNEDNGVPIDSTNGNNVISSIYALDQTRPTLLHETPHQDVTNEINVNEDTTGGLYNYPLGPSSPYTRPNAHRKPNLWRYYKYLFNNMRRRVNGKKNHNLINDFPINMYHKPTRDYYNEWKKYISHRQVPPYLNYDTHPDYVDSPKKHTVENDFRNFLTPEICSYINALPGRGEQYYDSNNINGRPIGNKRDYIVNILKRLDAKRNPLNIYENSEKLADIDYYDGLDPNDIMSSLTGDNDGPLNIENPDNNFNPISPLAEPLYSKLLREYEKPLVSNQDDPSAINRPHTYDPSYSHFIPNVYDETNNDGSDISLPVYNHLKPENDHIVPLHPIQNLMEDYIRYPSNFKRNYFSRPNEFIPQDIVNTIENDGFNAMPEFPDSQNTYVNSNSVNKYIPDIIPVPDKDTVTQEQYIRQIIDVLIPRLIRLYNSECSRGYEAELIKRLSDVIDIVQSENCGVSPEY